MDSASACDIGKRLALLNGRIVLLTCFKRTVRNSGCGSFTGDDERLPKNLICGTRIFGSAAKAETIAGGEAAPLQVGTSSNV